MENCQCEGNTNSWGTQLVSIFVIIRKTGLLRVLSFFIINTLYYVHINYMNNIKSYSDFLLEVKSDKDIVKDLARHLAFDKDIVKYLNTSRAKRELGWREMLDTKLHGKNKFYINYLTKNMIADYNPQITGYVHINDETDEEEFDQQDKDRGFDDMSPEEQIADLNDRVGDVEDLLGIDPDDDKTLDKVEKALDDAGYEKPDAEEEEE